MRKFFTAALCVLTLCLAALGAGAITTGAGETVAVGDLVINESYALGSAFTLPSATVDAGGTEKEAATILRFPSGTVTDKKSTVLTEAGKYVLEFSAVNAGKTYTETRSFFVDYPAYEFVGTTGTAAYGAHASEPTRNGLVVDMKTGGLLNFNKVINVSSLVQSDVLFEAFVTPAKVGEVSDFNELTVTFTDAYDSGNYVTMRLVNQMANYKQYSYAKVGSSRQSLTGVEMLGTTEIIHVNDFYGTPVRATFFGSASPYANRFYWTMDYASKSVYCNGVIVADLDSSAHFTDLWDGFTTGEAKVSVSASEGSDARMVITRIAGIDLSETEVRDTTAPSLTVDYDGYDELPVAVKGKPYRLFDAISLDGYSGECKVVKEVYRGYNSTKPVKFNVTDDRFTPTSSGTYTLVYTATDAFGNSTSVKRDVTAKSSVDALAFDFASLDGLSAKTGEEIDLSAVTAFGGSGRATVKTQISYSGENAYEITEKGFKPYLAGAYTVTFSAIDYVGNEITQNRTINVSENDAVVVEKEAAVPANLLDGFKIILPDMTAYAYDGGRHKASSVVTVTDAVGTRTLDGFEYTPSVNADGDKVTLTYNATYGSKRVTRNYSIPCYKVKAGEGINYLKYFRTDGDVTMTPQKSYTTFAASAPATVRFINPLLWSGFETTCRIQGNATRAHFAFTDSADATEKFEFDLVLRNGVVHFVSGDYEKETKLTFGKNFSIKYDGSLNKLFLDTLGVECDGLKAFGSGKAYFEWNMTGIPSGQSVEFRLIRLNGQTINNATTDLVAPRASLMGASGGSYALNATASTLPATWGDVFDTYSACTLTVYKPDGDVVTSIDGTLLQGVSPENSYRIKFDSYGTYVAEYYVVDSSGNDTTVYDRFRVWDGEPPVIEVNGVPSNVKVGQAINLPAASVTDNASSVNVCYVTVFTPDGKSVFIGGKSGAYLWTPQVKGRHRVVYYAFDKNGNMGTAEFVVTAA